MTPTPTPTPPTPPRASGEALDPIPRGRWTLTLECAGIGPPGVIRIRRLLKAALRGYGLRCVTVTEADSKTPSPTSDKDSYV